MKPGLHIFMENEIRDVAEGDAVSQNGTHRGFFPAAHATPTWLPRLKAHHANGAHASPSSLSSLCSVSPHLAGFFCRNSIGY